MEFVDSSVFVHAVLRLKPKSSDSEKTTSDLRKWVDSKRGSATETCRECIASVSEVVAGLEAADARMKRERDDSLARVEPIKRAAAKVLQDIDNKSLFAATTIVHLNEVANCLHKSLGVQKTTQFLLDITRKANVRVFEVGSTLFAQATELAQRKGVDPADALAFLLCEQCAIQHVYTFDRKHYEQLFQLDRLLPTT